MNIIPYLLIFIAIYAIIYIHSKYIEIENFQNYSQELFKNDEHLLVSDIYKYKHNIGLGNDKSYNRISFKNITNHKELKTKLLNSPDNNNCIPYELCNSFYGSSI